ncbi:MAG TPA: cation:dicarboxylase symporter family transporter [Sphingomonas sp.]|jgi:Na+/H+-dicarboxylate symporter|nr:cation:dicarboxylase symporter family transporter [Sphingomonas sp.]
MSQATRILLSLIVGLIAGVGIAAASPAVAVHAVLIAQPIGTLWLNGLQMTIVPLVVSLLVTGIAATAQAVRAGRVATRAITLIMAILFASAATAAILTPLLLDLVPLPSASAAALRSALIGAAPAQPVPPFGAFVVSIVPTNVLRAAADNAFLSLIVFTLVFAFAVTRIDAEGRDRITGFFAALRETMLVVIDWVLWLAPIGVFALALGVGASAGTAAFGALLHYVVIVSSLGIVMGLAAYPLARWGGRVPLGRFARTALPVQALAISTQSSLACLPAMLKGAEGLAVRPATAGVVLPLSVAMLRATGPAMNLAVAIYVARWFGIEISAFAMVTAVIIAALTSLGAVSLPGQISFISSIAPIAATLGIPLAPFGLLVAVETIPDIFRTLGNVTADLAVTATVEARSVGDGAEG